MVSAGNVLITQVPIPIRKDVLIVVLSERKFQKMAYALNAPISKVRQEIINKFVQNQIVN